MPGSGEVRVHFVSADGARWEVAGPLGETIMDCAVDNGVPGITAQCGGGCTCSTCHCYVPSPWYERVGPAQGDEADILEFTPGRRANSRLSCQVVLRADLDGITVEIPPPTD